MEQILTLFGISVRTEIMSVRNGVQFAIVERKKEAKIILERRELASLVRNTGGGCNNR